MYFVLKNVVEVWDKKSFRQPCVFCSPSVDELKLVEKRSRIRDNIAFAKLYELPLPPIYTVIKNWLGYLPNEALIGGDFVGVEFR